MSDEDRDVDIDTDDDDLGNSSLNNDATSKHNFQSQADKRAHHNALERKRRDHIKDSFSSLRDSVPALHGEKVKPYKASRAQILKKAAEYIQVMRRKNSAHQQDIDDIKRQNKILEEQIRALEKAKNGGLNNFSGTSLLDNKVKTESIDSSFDGISDTESSGSEVNIGHNIGNGNENSANITGENEKASFGPPNKKIRITNNVVVNDTSNSSSSMISNSGVITSI